MTIDSHVFPASGENTFLTGDFTEAVKTLKPHDHLCLVYETEEEWHSIITSFIAEGLRRNEKCIYVVDLHTADQIRMFLSEEGTDVDAAVASGQLVILHETEAYTKEGAFDPDKMIAFYAEEAEKALSEGYTALRITGEMSWALRGHPGSETLIEYEAKVNRDLFPHHKCVAICQYCRALFEPALLRYVVMTHPLIVRHNQLYRNPYYIPPEEFLSQKRNHYDLQHWLEGLEHQLLITETIRRSRELEALNAISSTIVQSLELKEVLHDALKTTVEVLNGEGGVVYLLDESRQVLVPAASFGFSKDISGDVAELKMGEWLSGYAAQVGDPVLVADLTESPSSISPVYTRGGCRSLASVPLKAESTLRGVLTVCSPVKGQFKSEDLSLLASIGNQIGMAVENAQLYEANQQELRERKRAEEALRRSEKRYRELIENISDAIYTCDSQGLITYVSPVFEAITGYASLEILHQPFTSLVCPEDLESIKSVVLAIISGHKEEAECRIITKSGQIRWVRVSGNPTYDRGSVAGAQGVIYDITERKKAEEEVMQLSTAVRMSSDSIVIVDMEGYVTYVNDATLQLYHTRTREDLVGKRLLDLVIPDDRRRVMAKTEEALREGFVRDWEYDLVVKDGKRITVETNMVVMKTAAGVPRGFVGITRDITERKKTEKEMKRKLMRYDLQEGKIYLVKEMKPCTSIEAFEDLLTVGYPGLALCRTPNQELKGMVRREFDHVWVAEKGGEPFMSPFLEKVADRIEALKAATALFIDRLDYLMSKVGFDETLSFVQTLREVAYLNGHVIILSVDPSTLSQRELSLLEKEASDIEPLRKTTLSEDLFSILKIVYERNSKGMSSSYTTIGKKIETSKPTTRRRIRALISDGYLEESKKGRTKVINLTEKGRVLFL